MRQAKLRLPLDKRSDAELKKEMSLRPVQCLLCGAYFHLPHLTNRVALSLAKYCLNFFEYVIWCYLMLFDFLDFFGIAQVVLFFCISIVFALRDRHETSKFHQKAAAKEQDSGSLSMCNGLVLNSPSGLTTLFGIPEAYPLLEKWVHSGCISVIDSPLQTI